MLVSGVGWNGAAVPGRRGMGDGGRPGGDGVRVRVDARVTGLGANEGERRELARVTGEGERLGGARVTGEREEGYGPGAAIIAFLRGARELRTTGGSGGEKGEGERGGER